MIFRLTDENVHVYCYCIVLYNIKYMLAREAYLQIHMYKRVQCLYFPLTLLYHSLGSKNCMVNKARFTFFGAFFVLGICEKLVPVQVFFYSALLTEKFVKTERKYFATGWR